MRHLDTIQRTQNYHLNNAQMYRRWAEECGAENDSVGVAHYNSLAEGCDQYAAECQLKISQWIIEARS